MTEIELDRRKAEDAFLRTRTDAELNALALCYPVVTNDASNPMYDFNRRVREELTRRVAAKRRG